MAEGRNSTNTNTSGYVFGLDIGTRSVVGTVGYKTGDTFHVVAQAVKEHTTRAMLDGQIHDIERVGSTIKEVKDELEQAIGGKLNEVCIAAAGRVLKTVNAQAAIDFPEETTVDAEHIYTLEMLGVENAYELFQSGNNTDVKFYCVGYTVMKYYLNDYPMTALEHHKAKRISLDLIATFLPDEVVDGLYKSVELAGLQVANLTLEPIAAMTAAIPVKFRMLNIALVDVGAGTSDISITKDGSIIAYGMIPKAGDELTEAIASALLLDFNEAEKVKIESGQDETVCYEDIMGLTQTIEPSEILGIVDGMIQSTARDISDKIKELNGERAVSAVFVVGGGGKITGFTKALADEMGIMAERVALRGEEVLRSVDYQFDGAMRDSLFVTPIGICLNYYEQRNNFVFISFNDERIKLYDNGHLTVADAAMQASFPNDGLFPKRGQELTFTVNGKAHMVRGELGEPAVIRLNDREVSLNTPIQAGDKITVTASSAGAAAKMEIGSLSEFGSTISVVVNDKKVQLPKFAEVNGSLQSEFYEIADGDEIRMLNYYTVKQIAEFMDVLLKQDMNIYVNNKIANLETEVYENFSVIWSLEQLKLSDVENEAITGNEPIAENETDIESIPDYEGTSYGESEEQDAADDENTASPEYLSKDSLENGFENTEIKADSDSSEEQDAIKPLFVIVNGKPVMMSGKKEYIFVDIFDYIDFDLSKPHGTALVTKINGEKAQYSSTLSDGDTVEIYWKKDGMN